MSDVTKTKYIKWQKNPFMLLAFHGTVGHTET